MSRRWPSLLAGVTIGWSIVQLLALSLPWLTADAAAAQADAQSAAQRFAIGGDRAAAAGHRGLVADGNGNASGSSSAGLRTVSGGQGLRTRSVDRSADGSLAARGSASVSGAKGSAQRSGDFTRNADGTASGQRSGSITRAETGDTRDASATFTKGEGVSRSVGCSDASGQPIDCPRQP